MKKFDMDRFLDIVAAICMLSNVQWDEDFPDDEYVLRSKGRSSEEEPVVLVPDTSDLSA